MTTASFTVASGGITGVYARAERLSNGWIVQIVRAPDTSGNYQFWVSTDNGASFHLHCTATNLFDFGSIFGFNGTIFAARDASAMRVASFNIASISQGGTVTSANCTYSGNFPFTDIGALQFSRGIWCSDGYMYVTAQRQENNSGETTNYDYFMRGTYNGSFTTVSTNFNYNSPYLLTEHAGYMYFLRTGNGADVHRIALGGSGVPEALTGGILPSNSGNQAPKTFLLSNPVDGKLYAVYPSSLGVANVAICAYEGSAWVKKLDTAIMASSNELVSAQIAQDGTIWIFHGAFTAGNALNYRTVTNGGTSMSAATLLASNVFYTPANPLQNNVSMPNYRKFISFAWTPGSTQSATATVFTTILNTAPNAPTITSPTDNQNIETRTPTIAWTFSDPDAGDNQSAFLVEVVNSAYTTVVWSSGWITGSQKSYTLPTGAIPADNTLYYIRLKVRDQAGVDNAANGNAPDTTYRNVRVTVVPKYYYNKYNSSLVWIDNSPWVAMDSGNTQNPAGSVTGYASYRFDQVNNRYTSDQSTGGVANLATHNDVYGPESNNTIQDKWTKTGFDGVYTSYQHYRKTASSNTQQYVQGTLVQSNIVAPDGTYPANGRHTDGYWYVRGTKIESAPNPPTITAPANGVLLTNKRPTITWTYSDPASSPQAGYRIQLSKDSWTTIYFDSGDLAGSANSWTPSADLPDSTNWSVAVSTKNSNSLQGPFGGFNTFKIDTTPPDVPAQTNGILYAVSNGVSWSAFSDGDTSGLLSTTLYLESYNGSVWSNVAGFPKSVAGISSSLTGLTPVTQYRWGIVYTDNAGNANTLTYTTFTTNTYAVSTITNLTSSGYMLNLRPRIKFTVTDANDGTLTNFETQFATDAAFTLNVGGNTASAAPTQYNVTSAPSGSTIYFTPTGDRTTGVWYVRVRAFDGKDWGTWSATVTFTLNAVNWATVVADVDTTISKRTIDDIRVKINAVRQARGLAVASWTDDTINDWNSASPTHIRIIHLIELRQAIVDIYTALGITAPTWAPDTIIDTSTNRKGSHWNDLRSSLVAA
jgi:hypothetical protein